MEMSLFVDSFMQVTKVLFDIKFTCLVGVAILIVFYLFSKNYKQTGNISTRCIDLDASLADHKVLYLTLSFSSSESSQSQSYFFVKSRSTLESPLTERMTYEEQTEVIDKNLSPSCPNFQKLAEDIQARLPKPQVSQRHYTGLHVTSKLSLFMHMYRESVQDDKIMGRNCSLN